MKVLSLFDGISGGQLALRKLGIQPAIYFASEIDSDAIACTMRNFPKTVQLGCVREVRKFAEMGFFGNIDLLIAGSPCQGFSSAGEQRGFDDPRSGLFFEFLHILALVKPSAFMLENVKMRQDWLDVISNFLGVQPVMINSADFSAQNRVRFYWSNLKIADWKKSEITLTDVLNNGWYSDRKKSYCLDANYWRGSNFKRYFFRGGRQIVFRNGFNPFVPNEETANIIQRLNLNDWRMLTVAECERLQTVPNGYTDGMPLREAYRALGNGWTINVVAHVLSGLLK